MNNEHKRMISCCSWWFGAW